MAKVRRLEGEVEVDYTPARYIMFCAEGDKYIEELAALDIKAHREAGILPKSIKDDSDNGFMKIVFDNEDELLVYCYGKAQIAPLKKREIDKYN